MPTVSELFDKNIYGNESINFSIQLFNLDFKKMNELLIKHNAIIGGSTALQSYCYDNGKEQNIDDLYNKEQNIDDYRKISDGNDLDVFVQVTPENFDAIKNDFQIFLNDQKYVSTYSSDLNHTYIHTRINKYIFCEEKYEIPDFIFKQYNYSKQRYVNIIYIVVPPLKMLLTVDLSFCTTAWDGIKYIVYEELTKHMIGYYINEPKGKEKERRGKYEKRGYKIFNSKKDAYDFL